MFWDPEQQQEKETVADVTNDNQEIATRLVEIGHVTNSIISCNLALLAPWGRRRSLNVHLVTLTYISILVEL